MFLRLALQGFIGAFLWTTVGVAQEVVEVTIAAPDLIAVEVRDPPFATGGIRRLDAPSREPRGSWISAGHEWGIVVGPDRDYVRTSDTPPIKFIDRSKIDDVAGYGEIGGYKVKAVYRKSVPYDSGIYRGSGGETLNGASLKHYIYLQLEQPLAEGLHTIRWPNGALPDTRFSYAQNSTRAIAIRANQHGYRGSDDGKVAYLALWLPGGPNEGAVDFRSYGLKTFHIIDSAKNIVFTGEVVLRTTPADPEPGNGLPTKLLEYPSGSTTPTVVTAIRSTTPVAVTAPGHGFASGQRIWLDRFSGQQSRLNGFATVGTILGSTFELSNVDGAGLGDYLNSGAVVLPAHLANRAATYVFELDFSAWRSKQEGNHQIFVPGLGVSDTFAVRDDIWLSAGQMSIAGLYNHRSGISLDGRFGFSRPASFRPGATISVRESKLPLAWSKDHLETGFVPFAEGGAAPWLSEKAAPPNYWGGYMDAGDWDRNINHVDISYLLLDVFENIPERMRSMHLGIPQSSEVLDRDLYSETADIPDLVHEAVWNLDFYRRLQLADGRVRGGIESAGHPMLGEPSYLEHQTAFAFAPDHISAYRFSAAAAKLAGVLGGLKKSRVAAVFAESARAAWRSAEDGQRDPDMYYSEAIAAGKASGVFETVSWGERKVALLKRGADERVAAAAALYRLTGATEYQAIFEVGWGNGRELTSHIADGAWEYLNSLHPTVNLTVKAGIRKAFGRAARSIALSQKAVSYPSMKHPGAPMGWGQGLAPDYNQAQLFIRAHKISGDRYLLRVMEIASAQILGANQVGLSFTTGLGKRTIKHPLHEDHRAMGIDAPKGITSYGWAPQAQTSYEWVFGPYWSALPVSGTEENAAYRRVEPNRFTMPFYDYIIEHPMLISQQEYTVHQTIATTAAVWLYLHATGSYDSPPN
jgi:endoglucanase